MPKKLQPVELESIIRPLPTKDKLRLREQELTPQFLDEQATTCKRLMNRDLWFGLPWFIVYGVSLWVRRFDYVTIGVFAVGMAYFLYTIFTTGSYGLNRKRLQVYEELREKVV